MSQERRQHPRLSVNSLKAHITICRPQKKNIELDGQVIDISYSGIKIRLNSPIPVVSEGHLKIVMILPESQIPLTIQGEIKHTIPDSVYGVHYLGTASETMLDQLMFECVKIYGGNVNSDDGLPPI
ncbi:MAG: PilZ domain-containing protein [Gammaproteobacteria bacterium]